MTNRLRRGADSPLRCAPVYARSGGIDMARATCTKAFAALFCAFVALPVSAQPLDCSAAAADRALAIACAERRAEAALQSISARYAEIWARLGKAQRTEFSAHERRWLHPGRFEERDRCAARHAALGDPELLAAICLAEVTERHLATLQAPTSTASAR